MGAGGPAHGSAAHATAREGPHSAAPAHHGAAGHAAAKADAHRVPAHGTPGGDHGCLMMMACGAPTVGPVRSAMVRIPAVFVRAAYKVAPSFAITDVSVETPPPRLAHLV